MVKFDTFLIIFGRHTSYIKNMSGKVKQVLNANT